VKEMIKKFLSTLVLAVGISFVIHSQPIHNAGVKIVLDTTIFQEGTVTSCHASTIVEISPGQFIAAWFAGSHEGANDVGIWSSTYQNNKWTNPIEVAVGYDSLGLRLPCWNPVLFKTKNNTLILFYKVGPNPREWWGMEIHSSNGGKSWSNPQKLANGFLGPIKNKPIQLSDGRILCPSSVESVEGKWSVHLETTNEKLSEWKKVKMDADSGVGVIQPVILQHSDGKLQMLCRSQQNSIYEAWSTDNGMSWSRVVKTSLPNPNSGIDAVTLEDNSFLLVYNPLLQGTDWFYGRNVLNVAISNDGENWKDAIQLENEKEGEFSYPAVIQASDRSIHITYTKKRKTIKHVVLTITEK